MAEKNRFNPKNKEKRFIKIILSGVAYFFCLPEFTGYKQPFLFPKPGHEHFLWKMGIG